MRISISAIAALLITPLLTTCQLSIPLPSPSPQPPSATVVIPITPSPAPTHTPRPTSTPTPHPDSTPTPYPLGYTIDNTVYMGLGMAPTLIIPNEYTVNIYQSEMLTTCQAAQQDCAIQLAAVDNPTQAERLKLMTSPDGTYHAFITYESEDAVGTDHIYIERREDSQLFEVQGVPLPYRPFANLTWLSNTLLTFDRWAAPNYGHRYLIDVASGEVNEAILADQYFIEGQEAPVGR